MRFDLKNSRLLYEVRYKRPDCEESYSYEYLYKDKYGRYFMHFEGGAYSEYAVKTGYIKSAPRSGNYYIDEIEVDLWKETAAYMSEKHPGCYTITDWEAERFESLEFNEEIFIPQEKLPF